MTICGHVTAREYDRYLFVVFEKLRSPSTLKASGLKNVSEKPGLVWTVGLAAIINLLFKFLQRTADGALFVTHYKRR